ncbi:MAG: DUF2378 family protein [Sandaracinaceae bacterium]|nr:DUF2378 family protein [Sandaracinaceae bacterium]
MGYDLASFAEPPWGAPLDAEAVIAGLPPESSMRGMFLSAVVGRAARDGLTLPSARERYLPFEPYPLHEHCRLLVELARAAWPQDTLRQGLRRIGRGAAQAFRSSTFGGVTVGAADNVGDVLAEMAKTFAVLAKPGRIEVVERGGGYAVLELTDIHFFLDSHHVGVYESALRLAGARDAHIRVRLETTSRGHFLCTWDERA